MIKINLNRTNSEPFSEFSIYNSLNPIPATLKLSNALVLPDTIYSRNLAGENFIEFRFNKETRRLYEITIVAIQEETVKLDTYNCSNNDGDYYECFIKDGECELEFSKPIQILRSENSLNFSWDGETSKKHAISKNCILGTDVYGNLCSIILINLTSEIIYEILGF